MLRTAILAAARSETVRRTITHAPISRRVVRRFVAGEDVEDAVRVARALQADGLHVSLDHLGEDTTDASDATATVEAYVGLLDRLASEGLAARAEVSVKLTAVGLDIDPALATANALRIVDAARTAGTTVTIDMEGSDLTDKTLAVVADLRREEPDVGAVLQAMLRRTEDDCRALAVAGSRVRLCKGAYAEPPTVAFQDRADVDASYARCLGVLMRGPGRPLVATHDPALVDLACKLAEHEHRPPGSWELQMLYGVRPDEQKRLVAAGHTVRVYVPYGAQWYGYLMRRLAERPANLGFFLRALASRS
ncbi:MAG TPA: proline dehydrogenase family protein [Mycobacteriales bacterium]|nr:proline dehydrogenase family protein [Mycobacteriales bacterium]